MTRARQGLEDAFWRFSLTLYGRPGAADRCLALQDAHGFDVNVALYCLWVGATQGRLATADLGAVAQRADAFRDRVVAPLRAVRREMKRGPGAAADPVAWEVLRAQIKATELAAEEAQQRAMAALTASVEPPPGPAAARANLLLYARRLEGAPSSDASIAATIDALVDAAAAVADALDPKNPAA